MQSSYVVYIFTLDMDIELLPDNKEALRGIISHYLLQIADKYTYIIQLEEKVKLLQNVIFCAKSEKYPKSVSYNSRYYINTTDFT